MKIIQIIKLIIFGNRHKKDFKVTKEFLKKKGNFKNNIHSIKNRKKYGKQFINSHFNFKYRIVVPVILIFDKFFKKWKYSKIKKSPENYLLLRFDKAYETALRDWIKFYLQPSNLVGKHKKYITKKLNQNYAIKHLKSIKEWSYTILLMDQAYKEFFNMLMLNLAKQLQKEFKGKNAKHLIYNKKIIDDIHYFALFSKVKEEIEIGKFNKKEK